MTTYVECGKIDIIDDESSLTVTEIKCEPEDLETDEGYSHADGILPSEVVASIYTSCEVEDKEENYDNWEKFHENKQERGIEIAEDVTNMDVCNPYENLSSSLEEEKNDLEICCSLYERESKRRRPQKNKKVIRKTNREHGKEYISVTGKVVPEKQFSTDPCGCRLQCLNMITLERRQQIFQEFYNLNWTQKNSFLFARIQVTDKKRKYTSNELSRRSNTRIYTFSDDKGESKVVCKKFFQDTLQICDGTITNVLKRKKGLGGPPIDRRGRHVPHNKKVSDSNTRSSKYF